MQVKDFKKQKETLSALVEMKPTLSLTSKDLPDLKKWKVGKEYDIELHVRQKGMHEMSGGEVRADFEIMTAEQCENEEAD